MLQTIGGRSKLEDVIEGPIAFAEDLRRQLESVMPQITAETFEWPVDGLVRRGLAP